MKLLFDFPQCFLVPIFVAVIFAVVDIVLNKRISKLFFFNFIVSIIFLCAHIMYMISFSNENGIIEQFKHFLHTDAVIAVVIVWIPLLIEIIIINAIVLAYKKFIDNTNR